MWEKMDYGGWRSNFLFGLTKTNTAEANLTTAVAGKEVIMISNVLGQQKKFEEAWNGQK
jgi:hypothetical protein